MSAWGSSELVTPYRSRSAFASSVRPSASAVTPACSRCRGDPVQAPCGSWDAVGRQRYQRKDHCCYSQNDRRYGKNNRGPCSPLQRQRSIFLGLGRFDLCLRHSSPNLNLCDLAVNGTWI